MVKTGGATVAASLTLATLAGDALACPSCAANPGGGITRYILIGFMIVAPYVSSLLVIRFIRKGEAAQALDVSRRHLNEQESPAP